MAMKRRSNRQAAGRKRSIYAEPDSDEDLDVSSDDEADYAPEPVTDVRPQKKRKTASRPQRRTKASASVQSTGMRQTNTHIIGRQRKPRTTDFEKHDKFRGPTDGKIPEWSSLPLAILRDVFVFASQPFNSGTATWLLKSARTCRAFAEPALEAYYMSPIMRFRENPHDLLDLVRSGDDRIIKYSTKIRNLDIPMECISYTATHKKLFNLTELVAVLPRLQHLEVKNRIDVPPYRRLPLQQWRYPLDLFSTLIECGHQLKTWRWSRDMIDEHTEICPHIASVHDGKPFSSVEKLVLCGFDIHDTPPVVVPNDKGEAPVLDLAWAICRLPSLKSLSFTACDVVCEGFLTKLPTNLESLEIINCFKLTSNILETYLKQSGSGLKSLTFLNNPWLSLSFLTPLKQNCPQLEHLTFNGKYYSERVAIDDAQPEYEALLLPTEVPTWPTTLRHLKLTHLQKWGAEAGVHLFRSLTDSASELPDLRCIEIEAHINVPWRDRAGFRDEWIERIRRVFLRSSLPPNPYHGSKKQWEAWKAIQDASPKEIELTMHPPRPSSVVVPPHEASGDTDVYPDTDASPVMTRRSTRVAHTRSLSQQVSINSEDTGADSEQTDAAEDEAFVQGLCNTVKVSIDNMRPREVAFTANDFMDSEASGDEDWNENADIEFED